MDRVPQTPETKGGGSDKKQPANDQVRTGLSESQEHSIKKSGPSKETQSSFDSIVARFRGNHPQEATTQEKPDVGYKEAQHIASALIDSFTRLLKDELPKESNAKTPPHMEQPTQSRQAGESNDNKGKQPIDTTHPKDTVENKEEGVKQVIKAREELEGEYTKVLTAHRVLRGFLPEVNAASEPPYTSAWKALGKPEVEISGGIVPGATSSLYEHLGRITNDTEATLWATIKDGGWKHPTYELREEAKDDLNNRYKDMINNLQTKQKAFEDLKDLYGDDPSIVQK